MLWKQTATLIRTFDMTTPHGTIEVPVANVRFGTDTRRIHLRVNVDRVEELASKLSGKPGESAHYGYGSIEVFIAAKMKNRTDID